MASIFKRKGRKNEPYTIQYFDHLGKRRTQKGFTDKGLTEQLAAKLEGEARLRTTGLVDLEQERYAEQKLAPIAGHLEAFEEALADKSSNHVKLTMSRVRRVVDGCGFGRLADFTAERAQSFLRAYRKKEDLSRRTYNHYLEALDAFLNWCVSTKRLLANPMAGVERLNTEVDIRHKRRALTADEVGRVVAAARRSGVRILQYSGEERARVYIVAYMTGLRKKELASLTPRSFDLDGALPQLTVEAAFSKHRRKDVLPLHPELVKLLREWLSGMAPGQKLFANLASKDTAKMIRQDLKLAGIEYETADGIADFHAAGRHSYITELLRNGATLPEAKELARHSDVKMTMRYTHIGMADRARAVANLPAPRSPVASPPNVALHRRCNSGGFESPSASPNGTGERPKSSPKSLQDAELDADRPCVSPNGTNQRTGLIPVVAARPANRRAVASRFHEGREWGQPPAVRPGASHWQSASFPPTQSWVAPVALSWVAPVAFPAAHHGGAGSSASSIRKRRAGPDAQPTLENATACASPRSGDLRRPVRWSASSMRPQALIQICRHLGAPGFALCSPAILSWPRKLAASEWRWSRPHAACSSTPVAPPVAARPVNSRHISARSPTKPRAELRPAYAPATATPRRQPPLAPASRSKPAPICRSVPRGFVAVPTQAVPEPATAILLLGARTTLAAGRGVRRLNRDQSKPGVEPAT